MCGICGATDDPQGAAVRGMNACLVHRGPDDEGIHVDAQAAVALGARRLSIIDVQGGHQPLSNEDGTVWAVLNGEIYNHPALRERLRAQGHRLATQTDTEVLVHLYEDYGDELVHALEGMFAFAVWDAGRRRLLLGRDRFGEKPLFYSTAGGRLRFASELEALRQSASGELSQLDPAAVDEFLIFGYVTAPRAMFVGTHQLPPGHTLSWESSDRSIATTRYWTSPAYTLDATVGMGEIVAEADQLLRRSVRSRMIADVPLGAFLSGGLDSTLIAALAAQESSGPLRTFTVGYGSREDETARARRCATVIGADHRELRLTDEQVGREAPVLLASVDQPIADRAFVAMHALAAFARSEVTVAIGGEGADELFGGYGRYRWLVRGERLQRLLPSSLAHVGSRALARVPDHRARRMAEVLAPRATLERNIDWVTESRGALRGSWFGSALFGAGDGSGHVPDALARGHVDWPPQDLAGRLMLLDQAQWLDGDVLAKADRASMLASLEMRTPYLHPELAELAAAVPTAVHLRAGGKSILRRLQDLACPGLGSEAKRGFNVPAARWLRGPLAPVLEDQVRGGLAYDEGWLDRAAVRRMLAEHRSGAADWTHSLWPSLTFGLWLDRVGGDEGPDVAS